MDARLCLRELAVLDEVLDIRMVARDLMQHTVAQEVEAAVPDMGPEGQPLLRVQQRRRRPHALAVRILCHRGEDLAVGAVDGAAERLLLNRSAVSEIVPHCLDENVARDFSGRMAAHAVCHDVDLRVEYRSAVLIDRPHTADIGRFINLTQNSHLSNRRVTSPMRILSPGRRYALPSRI